MLPILEIGPLVVPVPAILLLLGLWLGLSLAERHAMRFGISNQYLYNLVFVALISGLVGARLAYVLRYPQAFLSSPFSIISPNPGLLDPWGFGLGALIGGLIYGQRKHLPFWQTLDALTPLLAVLAVTLGLSHLASGAAFGLPTELPWGIELWGASRHPSQIYETLAAIAILVAVWPGRGLIRSAQPGVYFLSYVALSAGAHLFLEAFRGDSAVMAGGFRLAQVLAWVILALALWALARKRAEPPAQTQ